MDEEREPPALPALPALLVGLVTGEIRLLEFVLNFPSPPWLNLNTFVSDSRLKFSNLV